MRSKRIWKKLNEQRYKEEIAAICIKWSEYYEKHKNNKDIWWIIKTYLLYWEDKEFKKEIKEIVYSWIEEQELQRQKKLISYYKSQLRKLKESATSDYSYVWTWIVREKKLYDKLIHVNSLIHLAVVFDDYKKDKKRYKWFLVSKSENKRVYERCKSDFKYVEERL